MFYFFNLFAYLLQSLKCRTGIQHSDQLQKIIQVCKKRSAGDNNNSHESSLSEDDDNKDHSLDINIFDTKFLSNKFYNAESLEDSNNNW